MVMDCENWNWDNNIKLWIFSFEIDDKSYYSAMFVSKKVNFFSAGES